MIEGDKYSRNRQKVYDLLKENGYTDKELGGNADSLFSDRNNASLAYQALSRDGYSSLANDENDFMSLLYGPDGEKPHDNGIGQDGRKSGFARLRSAFQRTAASPVEDETRQDGGDDDSMGQKPKRALGPRLQSVFRKFGERLDEEVDLEAEPVKAQDAAEEIEELEKQLAEIRGDEDFVKQYDDRKSAVSQQAKSFGNLRGDVRGSAIETEFKKFNADRSWLEENAERYEGAKADKAKADEIRGRIAEITRDEEKRKVEEARRAAQEKSNPQDIIALGIRPNGRDNAGRTHDDYAHFGAADDLLGMAEQEYNRGSKYDSGYGGGTVDKVGTAIGQFIKGGINAVDKGTLTMGLSEAAAFKDVRRVAEKNNDLVNGVFKRLGYDDAAARKVISEAEEAWEKLQPVNEELSPMAAELKDMEATLEALAKSGNEEKYRATYDKYKKKYEEYSKLYKEKYEPLQKSVDKYTDLMDAVQSATEEGLSESEKAVLDAFGKYVSAKAWGDSNASVASRSGEGLEQTFEFMLDFILTRGVEKAGTKAATKMMANGTLKKYLGETGAKIASKGLADIGVGTVRTSLMFPRSLAAYGEQITQMDRKGSGVDEFGRYKFDRSKANAAVNTALTQFIEYWSEGFGEYFSAGERALFRKVTKNAPKVAIGQTLKNYRGSVGKYLDYGKFDGHFNEMLEEVAGSGLNALAGWMSGDRLGDKEAMKEFWGGENLAVLNLSFLPLSVIGVATNMKAYHRMKSNYDRGVATLNPLLENGSLDRKELEDLTSRMPEMTPEQIRDKIVEITDSARKKNGGSLPDDFAPGLMGVLEGTFAMNMQHDAWRDAAENIAVANAYADYYEDPDAAGSKAWELARNEQAARDAALEAGFTEEDLDEDSAVLARESGSMKEEDPDRASVLYDYAYAKAQSDGLRDGYDNASEEYFSEIESAIRNSEVNGNVIRATDAEGNVVFITSQDATVDSQGLNTPTGRSGLVSYLTPDGNLAQAKADSFTDATSTPTGEYVAAQRQNFMSARDEWFNIVRESISPEGMVAEIGDHVGRTVYVDANGTLAPVRIERTLDNGGTAVISGDKKVLGGIARAAGFQAPEGTMMEVPATQLYSLLAREDDNSLMTDMPSAEENAAVAPAAEPAQADAAPEMDVQDLRGSYQNIRDIDGQDREVFVTDVRDNGDVVYEYEDENGRTRQNVLPGGDFVNALQENQAPATEAPVAPESTQAPAARQEVVPQSDFRGNPIPMKDGQVDQESFRESDPEAWARWVESLPEGDERRPSLGTAKRLEGIAKSAKKAVEKAQKELEKLYDEGAADEKIQAKEKELRGLTARQRLYDDAVENFSRPVAEAPAEAPAAEAAAEEAPVAEAPAPVQEESPVAETPAVEEETPVQAEEEPAPAEATEAPAENTDTSDRVAQMFAFAERLEAARKEEEERQRPLKEKVSEWEKRIGVKTEVLESFDRVTNKSARMAIIEGKRLTGWYDDNTGKVVIYLPNCRNEREIDQTYIHEVVAHKGIKGLLGTRGHNAFLDSVWKGLSPAQQARWLNYPSVKNRTDVSLQKKQRLAADEYVAHLSEDIDTNVSAWRRVVAKLKDALLRLGIKVDLSNADLAAIVGQSLSRYEKMAARSVTENEVVLNNNGMASDEEEVRFSVKYIPREEEIDKLANDISSEVDISVAEARKWIESELSLASLITGEPTFLDYKGDERYSAIKTDADYPQGTVDFNNICRKRLAFTQMYQAIQKAFPNHIISGEDLATIRSIMKEHGLTVACGLCYVEDRRQLLGEIAKDFIDNVKTGFSEYESRGGETKKKNAEKFRKLVGDDKKDDLSIYDLVTLEGSAKLRDEHSGIYEAFQAFNNARGQQAGNLFQGYAEYKREILKWSKSKVKSVNDNGGLRVFSYSDFEAHHLIDLVQIIEDCARKGVKIQGYTKVPAFARAVANTGLKLNRSLIPLGDTGIVDGKLAYDPVEGIDINDPNFLPSNDNVGNILIGINDEQIRLAMADPFIHFIIPYHSNQKDILRSMKQTGAWTNYKLSQTEKDANGKSVHGVNIYTDVLNAAEAEGNPIQTEREFTERFLQVCKERGMTPRFAQFLDRDGDGNYIYTPGYYKFLVDFKLFDDNGRILPQEPVRAEFDDGFNAEILNDYVKEEKAKLGENLDDVYNEIVDKLGLEKRDPDIRFRKINATQKLPASEAKGQVVEDDEVLFRLSKNNKATVESWLQKREDLTDEQRAETIDYIDKLNDAKTQLATAKWFTNRVIRIPEDMKKVEQAISVAGKAKVDPLRYNSPMELLEAHAEFKPKEARINPDEVSTLHRASEYPEQGIVVYDVDNTKASRENMRKIINTHFGEDASPWCLLQGDGKGNLTESSAKYWKHYNAYPKQVAFKDGKLLAFSANDTHTRVWWDRQDKSHYGIPMTMKVPGDELGRSADYIIDESGKPAIEPGGRMYRGNRQNGVYEEWNSDGTQMLAHVEFKDGKEDGLSEYWYPSGQLYKRAHMKGDNYAGTYEQWYENGQQKMSVGLNEKGEKDGDQIGWYKNGNKQYEAHYKDGHYIGDRIDYSENGEPKSIIHYNETGDMTGYEDYADFGTRRNPRIGLAKRVTYAPGDSNRRTVEEFYGNGHMHKKEEYHGGNLDGVTEYYYPDGTLQSRTHYVEGTRHGLKEVYYENGRLWLRGDFKDGEVDGIQEQWNKEGDLIHREEWKDGQKVRTLPLDEEVLFRVANQTQNGFISNAEAALDKIKMEKATPEQWVKMLEKEGGLKAGEDKWLGLSDWLKESDKKTLTKDELGEFIAQNRIQIEETHYSEGGDIDRLRRNHPTWDEAFVVEEDDFGNAYAELSDLDEAVKIYNSEHGSSQWLHVADGELAEGDEGYDRLQKWADSVLADSTSQAINSTRLAYTTEGLTNKREIALTVPTIDPWNESDEIHFGDADNGRAVAWVRFGDTTTYNPEAPAAREAYESARKRLDDYRDNLKAKYADSEQPYYKACTPEELAELASRKDRESELYKKLETVLANRPRVLVIDEIQSKRHQEGREHGYRDDKAVESATKKVESAKKEYDDYIDSLKEKYGGYNGMAGNLTEEENKRAEDLNEAVIAAKNEEVKSMGGIPSAPFERNWHELAMKRMLRLAAEEGYDYVAWTTGAQQAERYSLGGMVSKIDVDPANDGTREVTIVSDGADIYLDVEDENGSIVGQQDNYGENLRGKKLSDVVGKEMADKIMGVTESETIEGDGLRIGGEGMKGFYDDILPRFMNKYGKKWGVKVSDINLPNVEKAAQTMHAVPVTPEMKESVMEGQVMFREGSAMTEDGETISYESMGGLPEGTKRTSLVERTYKKTGAFSFTGKNKIESAADVAYIFKELETEAVENSFIVFVKDGKPTILHTGIGTINQTEIDSAPMVAGLKDFTPDKIYMVHNHPSGRVEASTADGRELDRLQMMAGDIPVEGIIIDTVSGEYGVFDKELGSTLIDTRRGEEADAVPLEVLTFNKMVFSPDYHSEIGRGIANAEDVAAYLSAHRLGEGEKLGALLLNQHNQVVGNLVFNENTLNADNAETLANDAVEAAVRSAANRVILFGDMSADKNTIWNFKNSVDRIGGGNVRWLDAVKVDGNHTRSLREGTLRDGDEESVMEGQTMFRVAPESQKLFDAAKERFGTTRDIREAGYVLPDGTMLDFSGRHWTSGGDNSWLNGMRQVDHREISDLEFERDGNTPTGIDTDMSDFIRRGAIRISYPGAINLYTKPTAAQRSVLARLISSDNRFVRVDFGDGSRSDHYADYDRARPDRILYDIDNYFDDGIKPEGQTLFRVDSDGESETLFRVREGEAPKKTQKVYKLMRLENGKLYPLFIDRDAEAIELGTWYDADSPDLAFLKKMPAGVFLVDAQNGTYTSLEDYKRKRGEKVGKLPSKADVEEASRNGLRWMKITEADRAQRRYDGENRKYENIGINGSEGVSTFAMRPGWHAGSLPTMRQIGKGAEKNLRDDKFVWVEGEISADVDYNEEAQGNPDKDIPTHIPTDGFYMKATNANKKASQADRVGWYVAGAFKPNRIMSDSEARQVIDAWNAEHQDASVEYDWPRESGREFNADTMSLEEGFNTYFRVDGTEEDRISYAEREATGVTLGRMGDGLGVKIRRIGSASMPAGHKTDKGYYVPSTGEMTVCMDNVTDERDAIATVLHETVGYKGLEDLFGDRFREAMANIYATLDQKGRAWVNGYISQNSLDFGSEGVTRGVMEYVSNLADSGNYNDPVWDSISDILGRVVDANFGTDGFTFTNREMDYVIRAATEHMKNPDWLNTPTGRALDTLMKRQLGINETDPDRPTDPDGPGTGILFRDGDTGVANEDYNTEMELWHNVAVMENQNADLPVKIGMEKVMKEVGMDTLAEEDDYLTRHNVASSRAQTEAHNFELFYFIPLLVQVRAIQAKLLGKSSNKSERRRAYERILDYLYAVSALERNAYKNTDLDSSEQRDWSGITSLMGRSPEEWQEAEDDAREMIDSFRSEVNNDAALDALWGRIRACTDFSLEHAYKHGLITRDEYETLHGTASKPRMWNYYLPLRGFDEKTAEETFNYTSFFGTSSQNPVVKKMKGRWTKADNPLANILNIAENEIVQGNDNWAKQALYSFTLNAGENTLLTEATPWFVKDPGTNKWILAEPAEGQTLEDFEKNMQETFNDEHANGLPHTVKKGRRGLSLDKIMVNKANRNEHLIRLKVAGVDKMIWVNGNPALAKAVNGFRRSQSMQQLRRASRALSNLFTTYSLDFTVKNLIRDTIYSRIALIVKEDRAYRHRFRKNWWSNFGYGAFAFPMAKLAFAWESGALQSKPAADRTKREQMFIDFMTDGGQTGYIITNSVNEIKRSLERSMRRAAQETGQVTIPVLGHYAKFVKTLNEAFELLTRFTAYETSRDMGRSGLRSAEDAKEISVNFNRRGAQSGEGIWGNIASYLGATHYFYNAGVQGFDNYLRLYKASPVKMTAITTGLAMMGILTPMINSLLAGAAAGGDGDDDWYWNLPEWVRRNNLILGTGRWYLAVPLPVEFRAPYGLGDIIGSAFVYEKTPNRTFGGVAGDIISTAAGILPVNPIEGYTSNGNIGDAVIRGIVPDATVFFVDWATNRDYTGRPLWKENPFSDTAPKSQGAFASTPKGIVYACQKLAEITEGGIDVPPGLVRDFMNNYGGGFFRTAEDISKLLFTDVERPRRWDNIPFLSGFTGHIDEDRSNSFAMNALNEYKDLADGIVKKMNSINGTSKISTSMLFGDPDSLPEKYQAKVNTWKALHPKEYELGRMYVEGMNNKYKMKQYVKGQKKGQWYKSKELERKGVTALKKEWKSLREEWANMPSGTEAEKSAKAEMWLEVQDAWHRYYDAEANLAEALMDYEYGR